jgi:hypothetical protein
MAVRAASALLPTGVPMKQALLSLIRPVLCRPVAEQVPSTGMRELEAAELRQVGGGSVEDSPKKGW